MLKCDRRAEEAAGRILEAFKTGNLPKAMAPIFIKRKDNVPCRKWSFGNQVLCALNGTSDARGFRQWREVGRKVKKGAKAFGILAPSTQQFIRVDPESGIEEPYSVLTGFIGVPVFAVEDTERVELPKDEIFNWLENLPLVEVAKDWGIKVDVFNGGTGAPQGKYSPARNQIALGVQNLSTWLHELMHAADNKLGNLKERGQHWRSETVAELGSAVLAEVLGMTGEADSGGAWNYINHYAQAAGISPLQACMDVLKRTCEAVNLILDAADAVPVEAEAAA